MYRLIGDNHTVQGLPYSIQVFMRAFDNIRCSMASAAGISDTELRLLSRVDQESQSAPSDFGDRLDLSDADTATVLEALFAKGLVLRGRDDQDAGIPRMELSATGHALIDRVSVEFQSSIATAADSLDEVRRFEFSSSLLKMARKLDDLAKTGHEL